MVEESVFGKRSRVREEIAMFLTSTVINFQSVPGIKLKVINNGSIISQFTSFSTSNKRFNIYFAMFSALSDLQK